MAMFSPKLQIGIGRCKPMIAPFIRIYKKAYWNIEPSFDTFLATQFDRDAFFKIKAPTFAARLVKTN
ncbi:hypothetical protein GLV81_08975 [Phnomibacter ginsenosidimutans]|uniref:Uncharacterized protein n=1 Tax=Phnomibacter ginsenosidimutans TaxID=2676868 RepID=A0A6I6GSS8_9BACT|nr:hypothetical protein GLV81_08975 [Phnomibacter ginsenosidimutans]